jgi:predicted PurR-regulated permease PerM
MIHGVPFLGFIGHMFGILSPVGSVLLGLVWGFVLLVALSPLLGLLEKRRDLKKAA